MTSEEVYKQENIEQEEYNYSVLCYHKMSLGIMRVEIEDWKEKAEKMGLSDLSEKYAEVLDEITQNEKFMEQKAKEIHKWLVEIKGRQL